MAPINQVDVTQLQKLLKRSYQAYQCGGFVEQEQLAFLYHKNVSLEQLRKGLKLNSDFHEYIKLIVQQAD